MYTQDSSIAEASQGLALNRPHSAATAPHSRRDLVRLVFWLQWLIGTVFQLGFLLLLTLQKNGEVAPYYRVMAVIVALGSVPLYTIFRVYSPSEGYLIGLGRLLAGWSTLVAALVFVAFVTKTSTLFSREVVLLWIPGGYLLQGASFLPVHYLVGRLNSRLTSRRRSLIVGTGDLARSLSKSLGESLVGFVEADNAPQRPGEHGASATRNVLGGIGQLRSLLRDQGINRVYIALPADQTSQIEGLYVDLLDSNVDVIWVPDIANLMLLNHSVQNVGGLPAVHLNESPLTSHPGSALLKLVMDRTLALLGLIVLGPLLVGTALAVKLSSPGPVLFRQKRHGWNGKVIEVLKFRSMRVHHDPEVNQAKKADARVTPVGRFLRRTSIDELPQLWNVLKGDMSLVGPRPHAVVHNNYYEDKILAYMARHRIKPGMTGYAQINGCRGETETLEKMQRRVELDLEYINNWSVWLDVKILLKTPLSLFANTIY